jgi:hypothetical protein
MGAFYYRDASFCKYIKNSDTRGECSKEKIEEAYKQFEEAGKATGGNIPGTAIGGGIPGITTGAFPFMGGGGIGSFIPAVPTGDTTGTGSADDSDTTGGDTTGGTTLPESNVKITDEMCIEILAHTYRGMELYSAGNMLAMSQVGQQLELLEKQYGIDSDSDAFTEACTSKIVSDEFMNRVYARMKELGSTVQN